MTELIHDRQGIRETDHGGVRTEKGIGVIPIPDPKSEGREIKESDSDAEEKGANTEKPSD